MGSVLGIVIRAISAHLIGKVGFTRAQAKTGAVTLIQRFGGALNLNIHYDMLVLDGVYITQVNDRLRFAPVAAPTFVGLTRLIEQISQRVGRHPQRLGLLVRDTGSRIVDIH